MYLAHHSTNMRICAVTYETSLEMKFIYDNVNDYVQKAKLQLASNLV